MGFVKFLTSKVFLKQLGLAVVALLVFSFFVLKWLDVTTNNGEFVVVPNLQFIVCLVGVIFCISFFKESNISVLEVFSFRDV